MHESAFSQNKITITRILKAGRKTGITLPYVKIISKRNTPHVKTLRMSLPYTKNAVNFIKKDCTKENIRNNPDFKNLS